jgi:hypothetical protein
MEALNPISVLARSTWGYKRHLGGGTCISSFMMGSPAEAE